MAYGHVNAPHVLSCFTLVFTVSLVLSPSRAIKYKTCARARSLARSLAHRPKFQSAYDIHGEASESLTLQCESKLCLRNQLFLLIKV